jgi:hypothetical protein
MEKQMTLSWDQVVQWLREPVHAWSVGAAVLLYVLGCCFICGRAGWSWLLGLVFALPGLNVILFLLLAFGPWPAQVELYRLRRLDQSVAQAAKRYSKAS